MMRSPGVILRQMRHARQARSLRGPARAATSLPLGEARLFAFEPGRRIGARLSELAGVVAGFAGLTLVFTWPQAANMYGVPDMGDPLLSIWRIAWVNHRIWRAPAALFDANIFHPEPL